MADNDSPFGRRAILQGVIGALTVSMAVGKTAHASSNSSEHSSANGLAYLGLAEGDRLGNYRVLAVRGDQLGAIAVVLSTETGRVFQLDVLAKDHRAGAVNGVRSSEHSTVFLLNGASGNNSSDEELGRGAMALAAWLSERERNGHRAPRLMTHAQRVSAYPDGIFKTVV